jgi:S1-C subfamily serine protease
MIIFSKRRTAGLVCASLTLLGLLASGQCVAAATAAPADPGSEAERRQQLESAQRRLDAAAREVADLSMSLSAGGVPGTFAGHVGGMPKAMLGINLGSQRDAGRDDGVEIMSVSPGSGAAQAGLKAGDVLTGIDGKSLKRAGEQSPRNRLLEAMDDVTPESRIVVEYLRENKPLTATVVARPIFNHMFTQAMPAMPALPALPMQGPTMIHSLQPFAFMRAEGLFGSAELVSLTPKLGQYFGAKQGLLVVRAPMDSRLQLEEGDVIVDIGGRVPSSPSHALQILSSYQPGEKLRLNLLRMKKSIAFDITVPEPDGNATSRAIPAPAALPEMPEAGFTMSFPDTAPVGMN